MAPQALRRLDPAIWALPAALLGALGGSAEGHEPLPVHSNVTVMTEPAGRGPASP